jgi:hypothetical protein
MAEKEAAQEAAILEYEKTNSQKEKGNNKPAKANLNKMVQNWDNQ